MEELCAGGKRGSDDVYKKRNGCGRPWAMQEVFVRDQGNCSGKILEKAIVRENFGSRARGLEANLARRAMLHSWGRNWRGASREAMRVRRRHGRGNEATVRLAGGRGVNGFRCRCGLNARV